MDINEVRNNARAKMKGFCAVCRTCDGVWCQGLVPGMGGAGRGDAFKRAYRKLAEIQVNMHTLHDVTEPDTSVTLWGQELSFPALVAPITGTKFNMGGGVIEREYAADVVGGAIDAGTIAMIGDTGDPTCYEDGMNEIKSHGGKGIAIIKPRANSEIIKRIRMAEEAGAIAVGTDIDGAGLVTMKLFGQPVEPKGLVKLKELVNATKLPFIVKGIMDVRDAETCVEAGVDTIIVSNHGGRALDSTPAPCEVLGEIVERCGKHINILADGSVRYGVDILKYLALGAKAVLIGRPVIWGSVGGRQEGVKLTLDTLRGQLVQSMILTGNQTAASISKDTIRV